MTASFLKVSCRWTRAHQKLNYRATFNTYSVLSLAEMKGPGSIRPRTEKNIADTDAPVELNSKLEAEGGKKSLVLIHPDSF